MLETRVAALLDDRDQLRQENSALQGALEQAVAPLQEEINMLKDELAREKTMREVAVQRIDTILLRVKERMPE